MPPAPDHRLDATDETVHYDWDRDRDPVLEIASGEIVEVECRDATDGQLSRDATPDDVLALEFEGHALTGPVAIAGAEPGDTLAIDVLELDHHGVGWTYAYPGEREKGLLPDEFTDAAVHAWDLTGDVGQFVDGIEVPLAPFPGVLGVAPAGAGPHSTTPPRRVGGNLDIKHLTAGSTLYLPIEVAGGLFSVGDCHAAQGDGEVCVTAIEAPMTVRLRLRLVERAVDGPVFETDGPFEPAGGGRAVATSGVAPDQHQATRAAISDLVELVHDEYGLSRSAAYLLCSVAADLKVNEVVNGNVVVSAYLSRALFD